MKNGDHWISVYRSMMNNLERYTLFLCLKTEYCIAPQKWGAFLFHTQNMFKGTANSTFFALNIINYLSNILTQLLYHSISDLSRLFLNVL